MKEIINKLLLEVDPDIKEIMERIEPRNEKDGFNNWQLLQDPANAILNWQALRDRGTDFDTLERKRKNRI